MPPCIEYANVSKAFGKRQVLRCLNLALAADLTTAIVGASGSGKTTLLQLANGLLLPDAGQVTVLGEPMTQSTRQSLRLGIGYSQQGAGLFPHLTVRENATLMARLQGWEPERTLARYQLLMQMLGLDSEFDQRYPFSLSGGQQQRVSLCRAMMLNPRLLLLDEPFSALDPLTRQGIQREFLELQRAETRSIVLVTHDMREAEQLAQHIVILRDGRIEQQGTPTAIMASPATDYVANLFRAGVAS